MYNLKKRTTKPKDIYNCRRLLTVNNIYFYTCSLVTNQFLGVSNGFISCLIIITNLTFVMWAYYRVKDIFHISLGMTHNANAEEVMDNILLPANYRTLFFMRMSAAKYTSIFVAQTLYYLFCSRLND